MSWILHINYEEYVVYGLVSDELLSNAMWAFWQLQVSFWRDDDDVHIVLYQYVKLNFYCAGIDSALYGFIMYVYLLSIYTIKID